MTNKRMTQGVYEERDITALGGHYLRHVHHLTALPLKSEIAAELAHRDWLLSRALVHITEMASDAMVEPEDRADAADISEQIGRLL